MSLQFLPGSSFKVLQFARKNRYPLRCSTFTYSDNAIPTQSDLLERYRGPFTTEQVENVKTLFRIVSLLLALDQYTLSKHRCRFTFFPFLPFIQTPHQIYHAMQMHCGQQGRRHYFKSGGLCENCARSVRKFHPSEFKLAKLCCFQPLNVSSIV